MRDATKHILFLDDAHASEAMAAMTLVQRLPDALEANAESDSCAPLKRVPDRKRMHKPLDHAGHKDWDGIDPVYDEDARQYDSVEATEGPEEAARRAIIRHPALVTVDGIQLYCFRRRLPYGPGAEEVDPHAQDPNHLEYWMRRLDEQLERSETLDAIVIPSPLGPNEAPRLEPLLARAKAAYPAVKILQLAPPATPLPSISPLVNAVVTAPKRELGEAIRQAMGVPALPPRNLLQEDAANRRNIEQLRDGQTAQYRGERYQPWRKEIAAKRAAAKRNPGDDGVGGR